jgi:tRNA A37 threonylcarbamoyltransferase TsaD
MSVLITGKHSEIILTEGVGKHTILGMTNDLAVG